ncbi:hypothetical protein C356_06324, partial [Cryptococcus neoformans c45]
EGLGSGGRVKMAGVKIRMWRNRARGKARNGRRRDEENSRSRSRRSRPREIWKMNKRKVGIRVRVVRGETGLVRKMMVRGKMKGMEATVVLRITETVGRIPRVEGGSVEGMVVPFSVWTT